MSLTKHDTARTLSIPKSSAAVDDDNDAAASKTCWIKNFWINIVVVINKVLANDNLFITDIRTRRVRPLGNNLLPVDQCGVHCAGQIAARPSHNINDTLLDRHIGCT